MGASGVAAFVARIMSLNEHELQWLHSDSELMKHINETQLLMEDRLQRASLQSKLRALQQQVSTAASQLNNTSNNITYYNYYPAAYVAIQQQQQQQQMQLQQQQQQQQQQHQHDLMLASLHCHQLPNLTTNATSALQIQQLGLANSHSSQLALDLRTTPTGQQPASAAGAPSLTSLHNTWFQATEASIGPVQPLLSDSQPQYGRSSTSSSSSSSISSSSTLSSSASSPLTTGAAGNNNQTADHHQQQQHYGSFNPKKMRLDEFHHNNQLINHLQIKNQHNHLPRQHRNLNQTNSAANIMPNASLSIGCEQLSSRAPTPASLNGEQETTNGVRRVATAAIPSTTIKTAKKYKGEFDEPTAEEVEERRRMLARVDTYHNKRNQSGECACILGSHFHDKTAASVLTMVDRWLKLPTEERIKTKWDVGDLPKEIPLSEIKKFEDLRREASNGRADFGGASKRKPLGIRSTRQFLLILYCLWGHPGRNDPMQRDGYCPHCFARIKKDNEQSTLVRVVNHFNMKHRRGANPRLSPNRDISTPAVACSQTPSPLAALTVDEEAASQTGRQSIKFEPTVVDNTSTAATSPAILSVQDEERNKEAVIEKKEDGDGDVANVEQIKI